MGDDARRREYDEALRIAAEGMVHDARGVARDGEIDVPRAKLMIDTDMRLAGKWDRARYGDTQTHVIDDRRGGGSEAEIREQLRELLLRNPDVRRELVGLDIVDADVIEDIERVVEGAGAVLVETGPSAASAAVPAEALRVEQQVLRSVFGESGEKKPRRPRKPIREQRAVPAPAAEIETL